MSKINKLTCDALVVGCGAAGYACAVNLKERGVGEVLVISEGEMSGTSRNAGSDKQTYYKLSLGGTEADSVTLMAEDLFGGGSVDGDNALCEAANSVRCFMRLLELGVGFPSDEQGVFVGYKTDHDKRGRATSAGPLTSKIMTELLEHRAEALGVNKLFGLKVIEVLKHENRAVGVLAVSGDEFYSIRAKVTVFATGGPAAIYSDSVYPTSQNGATGALLRAGAVAQNMTEWQFGLASVSPRWNVSGSYMQVLPSFVSVDGDGREHRFLEEKFVNPSEGLTSVFLKGYEWPFDSRKLEGSSVIDLLVYEETAKGRRVYLDYTENPYGGIDYSELSTDAYEYLLRAGVCFGVPSDRLKEMNKPAYDFYLSHGVDLEKERLEISLCAQHCNGGISVDSNWQSSIENLFVVGEAAGTHGVYRPGGSALNAGQVGALRAASYISLHPTDGIDDKDFRQVEEQALNSAISLVEKIRKNEPNARALHDTLSRAMSLVSGAIRKPGGIEAEIIKRKQLLDTFSDSVGISEDETLSYAFLLRDSLFVSLAVLTAMRDFYRVSDGGTRGSALCINPDGDRFPKGMSEFRYKKSPDLTGFVQQVYFSDFGEALTEMREVRKIPSVDSCFENVWKRYREREKK